MNIHETAENYLETILILEKRLGQVRSIDVANELGFSKPTISAQMKQFRADGMIAVDENGHILLTERGRAIAAGVYERHVSLTDFLVSIGVEKRVAAEDACRIEHDISEETFRCLLAHCKKQVEK